MQVFSSLFLIVLVISVYKNIVSNSSRVKYRIGGGLRDGQVGNDWETGGLRNIEHGISDRVGIAKAVQTILYFYLRSIP